MIFTGAFFFIIGLITFAQVIFLPGFIVLHLLRLRLPLLLRLIASFALSLMLNYWAIFFLVAAGIYTQLTYSLLFLCEIGLLCFLYRMHLGTLARQPLMHTVAHAAAYARGVRTRTHVWLAGEPADPYARLVLFVSLLGAGATFAYLVYVGITNVGSIFMLSDAVISWNRWALEWSTNHFPTYTWEYPQLLPVAWSLFYVTVGHAGEYFAKALMPLFPLGITAIMFYVGVQQRAVGWLFAVPAYVLLARVLDGGALLATAGYADTAVTFFAFASVAALLIGAQELPERAPRYLLLGALFAIGAAMTKQAGLYITLVYPLLAWVFIYKDAPSLRKRLFVHGGIYVGLFAVMALPFYLYAELAIRAGSNISVVPATTSLIYGSGRSLLTIVGAALSYLVTKTYGIFALYALLLIPALHNKSFRWIAGTVLIPYTLIWVFFTSYDSRNLALALPWWGLAAGLGLAYLLTTYRSAVQRCLARVTLGWVLLAIVLILGAVSPFVSHKITAQYAADQRERYDPELSLLMSNYFEHNQGGHLYTNFPIFQFLPAVENRIWSPYGGFSTKTDDFKEYFVYRASPEVSYIFAANYTSPAIKNDIEQHIATGAYTLIFRYQDSVLVKVNRHE